MKHRTQGLIPFSVPRLVTGRTLDRESFVQRSGLCEAAIDHWKTNNWRFESPMTWEVTASGLLVTHILDDSWPVEADLLERIKQLTIFLSFGNGTHPAATRDAIATHGDRPIAYAVQPLRSVTFGHISYVTQAAWPQEPVVWAGPVMG